MGASKAQAHVIAVNVKSSTWLGVCKTKTTPVPSNQDGGDDFKGKPFPIKQWMKK